MATSNKPVMPGHHLCTLCLLVTSLHCTAACPALSALLSNDSILANDTHLRAIFLQYGSGDKIPAEGVKKLLLDLGIPRDREALDLSEELVETTTSDVVVDGLPPEDVVQKDDADVARPPDTNDLVVDHNSLPALAVRNARIEHDHNEHEDHDHHDGHAHDHHDGHAEHDHHDRHTQHDHRDEEDGWGPKNVQHDDHAHQHSHDHHHGFHDYNDNYLANDDPLPHYADQMEPDCGNVSDAMSHLALGQDGELLPSSFFSSCPALISYMLNHSQSGCFRVPGDPFLPLPVLGRPGDPEDTRYRPHRVDIDPRYDPRNPVYDPRNPGYDPRARDLDYEQRRRSGKMRNTEYDGRGREYDRRDPRYDPRDPRNDHRDPKYRAQDPKYDSRDPKYNLRDPKYDPRDPKYLPKYDPRDPRNDPKNPAYDPRRPGSSWDRNRYGDRRYPDDDAHMKNRKRYELNRRGYGDQYPKRHPGSEFYDYDYDEEYRRLDRKESVYARWIGGVVSMLLIGCISLACTMVLPALRRTRHYDQANHFLLSLAVGTLAGDALIHLLPHAISMGEKSHFAHSDHNDNAMYLHDHSSSTHFKQALYGFTALMGIIIFLFLERLHNIRSGAKDAHGHAHGSARQRRGSGPIAAHGSTSNSTLPRNASLLLSDTAIDLPPSQKIGKKLSEHSKEDSFDNTLDARGDASRCFGGCPQNRSSTGDPNGNADGDGDAVVAPGARGGTSSTASTLQRDHHVLPVRRQPLKDRPSVTVAADLAERERLMNPVTVAEKLEFKPDKNDDSSSVNIVLQEYHVSHHGHSHHGHAHVSGRKDSLRMMILMGEGMHIFMDGMAIGAAFATSLTGGIATAIAVLCHELPHKVGDFALLFDMGMTRKTALQMVVLMWLLSVVGMIIGEVVGSIEAAAPWIYSFTAGIFLHLALVDLLSEVSVKGGETCSAAGQILLQMCGMLTGAGIMLLIAVYEHDLHNILAWAF